MSNPGSPSLMTLPHEVRDLIWEFYIPEDRHITNVIYDHEPWRQPRLDRQPLFHNGDYLLPGLHLLETGRTVRNETEAMYFQRNDFTIQIPLRYIEVFTSWLRRLVLAHGPRPFRRIRILMDHVSWPDFRQFIHLAELTRDTDFDFLHASVTFETWIGWRHLNVRLERHMREAMELGRQGRLVDWDAEMLQAEFDDWAGALMRPALRSRARRRAPRAPVRSG